MAHVVAGVPSKKAANASFMEHAVRMAVVEAPTKGTHVPNGKERNDVQEDGIAAFLSKKANVAGLDAVKATVHFA